VDVTPQLDPSFKETAATRSFVREHRALLYKHARAYVRQHSEKITVEDIAREMEVMITQLGAKGVSFSDVPSPDAYFRTLVRHAVGRARRRRTLIQQVAAGDDLHAVSDDLAALDADLPTAPAPLDAEAKEARELLDSVKERLKPADRLIFAVLIEDDEAVDAVAGHLSTPFAQVEEARARILKEAAAARVHADPDRRDPGASPDVRREAKLRVLARIAGATSKPAPHVEEPLIALVRDGDHSEDLEDAISHLADCAICRARLTEGEIEHHSIVVMAIEAPKKSSNDLERAAEEAGAKLLGRGPGRWTAVVDADRAATLQQTLEKSEQSQVTRLAVATPVEVPRPDRSQSLPPPADAPGTDAAEVAAWVQVARAPKLRSQPVSVGWTIFAVATVLGAMAIAYVLATQ
jgi:DNA-directed RNA polymerase specialized sigma24 family protein